MNTKIPILLGIIAAFIGGFLIGNQFPDKEKEISVEYSSSNNVRDAFEQTDMGLG